jgi:hypothetical protein
MLVGGVAAGLTADDVLFLKSALLEGQPAREAYAAWRPGFDIETVDYGRQRLLPLVHRNLVRLDIADPLMALLRGIRHYHWARNQLRLRATAPVLTAFHAAGIPVMALKGAALLASCLEDSSLRPMDDFDFMVPLDRVAPAVEVLAAHGFNPIGVPKWAIVRAVVPRMPGFGFIDGSSQEFDLHWHMMHRDQRANADAAFWESARPARLAGVEVLAPSFVHQMLHVIVHAAEWNPVTPLRWVADALTILNAARLEFDWDELAREAIARDMAPPVLDALHLLMRDLAIAVPQSALHALRRSSGGLVRFEFASRMIAPQERSLARRTFLELCDFRRNEGDLMCRPPASSLKPFLVHRLGASGVSRQLAVLLFWALNRPRSLRRMLRIDRWARAVDPESLPPPGQIIAVEPEPSDASAFIDGWSIPELTGRWTDGREARLAWRLAPDHATSLDCEIEAKFFTPPSRRAPRIEIWANDRLVQVWRNSRTGGSPAHCSFVIPAADLVGQTSLVLSFVVRGANSPYRAGVSDDLRALGLHLRRVSLRPGGQAD